MGKQLVEGFQIHGFDKVSIETRGGGALPVLILSITCEGHDEAATAPGLSPH